MDKATPNWLLYCRPGFERDCAEETQAKPLHTTPGSAYVLVRGKAGLRFKQLVFARQLLRVIGEAVDLPQHDRLTPLLAALPSAPAHFGALLLEMPDSEQGKTLSSFTRRLHPLLEQVLHTSGRLHNDPALPRLHIFFPDATHALLATSDPTNSSAAHMGIQRIAMSRDAPSRSYLKLVEAFLVLLNEKERGRWLKPGMMAVDLGAAPGGWSWHLLQRGMQVTAVDNGPLKGAVASHPALRHLRQNGFRYKPQRTVDWVVCDMVEQPQRVARLMTTWLTQGWARRALFNLKLPMKKRHEAVKTALDDMRSELAAHHIRAELRAKQLYHDREEITVLLAR